MCQHSCESVSNVSSICSCRGVGRGDGGIRSRAATHRLDPCPQPSVRALNRTLCVAQTMVYVLNVLSQVAPDWVLAHVPVQWVERYGQRLEHERLLKARRGKFKVVEVNGNVLEAGTFTAHGTRIHVEGV